MVKLTFEVKESWSKNVGEIDHCMQLFCQTENSSQFLWPNAAPYNERTTHATKYLVNRTFTANRVKSEKIDKFYYLWNRNENKIDETNNLSRVATYCLDMRFGSTYVGFHRHIWTNVISFKMQLNAENTCEKRICYLTFITKTRVLN